MKYEYKPEGVCSRKIEIEIDGDLVKNIIFEGGCPGNTKGVASLAEGMTIKEVIKRLKGIKCGVKSTSCPDQLAKALEMINES